MKLAVDFDRCASNARCMKACPEVFEVRDDGFLYILLEEPPEALRAKVERARDDCPTEAISIVD
jgi:ferredoxin